MRTTMQSSGNIGMKLLEQSLATLVNEGKVDFIEGFNRSNEKTDYMQFVDDEKVPEGFSVELEKEENAGQ